MNLSFDDPPETFSERCAELGRKLSEPRERERVPEPTDGPERTVIELPLAAAGCEGDENPGWFSRWLAGWGW